VLVGSAADTAPRTTRSVDAPFELLTAIFLNHLALGQVAPEEIGQAHHVHRSTLAARSDGPLKINIDRTGYVLFRMAVGGIVAQNGAAVLPDYLYLPRNALRIRRRTFLRAYDTSRGAWRAVGPEVFASIGGAEEVTPSCIYSEATCDGSRVEKGLVFLLIRTRLRKRRLNEFWKCPSQDQIASSSKQLLLALRYAASIVRSIVFPPRDS